MTSSTRLVRTTNPAQLATPRPVASPMGAFPLTFSQSGPVVAGASGLYYHPIDCVITSVTISLGTALVTGSFTVVHTAGTWTISAGSQFHRLTGLNVPVSSTSPISCSISLNTGTVGGSMLNVTSVLTPAS